MHLFQKSKSFQSFTINFSASFREASRTRCIPLRPCELSIRYRHPSQSAICSFIGRIGDWLCRLYGKNPSCCCCQGISGLAFSFQTYPLTLLLGCDQQKRRPVTQSKAEGEAKRRSAQAMRGRLLGDPLRCARAEPSAKVWFPYPCASAHRSFRVALRQEQAAVVGGGRREAAGDRRGAQLLP